MRMQTMAGGLILMAAGHASAETGAGPGAPQGLLCNLLRWPERVIIRSSKPHFSWMVNDSRRNAVQSAYRILVSSDPPGTEDRRGDVWDSGQVATSQSVGVEYAGPPLAPGTYCWRVRTWDAAGVSSPWSDAQTFRIGAPGPDLAPWETGYPLETERVPAERVVQRPDGVWFVDFGRAAFGTVELTTTGGPEGVPLTVCLGEVPAPDSTAHLHRSPGGSRRFREIPCRAPAGTATWKVIIPSDKRNTGPNAVPMPASVGEVMPFRYCEIQAPRGCVDVASVHQVRVHYPFVEDAAAFSSSNDVLNDIWELCRYSIKATTFTGLYVDGDRERIPYEGDAYINQLCHYCVDREYTMARRTLDYLITHPTWPAEWHLHIPLIAWAHYMYTGDIRVLADTYDDLAAKTLVALGREDGLIAVESERMTPDLRRAIHFNGELRVLVDWPPASFSKGKYGERDGCEMLPVNTVVNAFHYRALVIMAQVARALKRDEDAEIWQARARTVYRSFQEVFFDPASGRYIDGEGSTHSALHSNMFPLAFGLVPPDHVEAVVTFVRSRGMACSVYGAQHLLDGLYEARAAAYALELLTSRSDRGWAHMIYDVGTTITLEAWDDKYKPNQDWNHAWGAAPANLLPRRLLGIRPLAPAFTEVIIQPQPADLAWVRGTVPTVRGPISVAVNQEGERRTIAVSIPANTTAEVWLGRGDATAFQEGQAALSDADGVDILTPVDGHVRVRVGAGSYRFAAD